MPKLEFETWTCGDVQCGCNEARLYLDSEEVIAEFGVLIPDFDSEREIARDLINLMLELGFPAEDDIGPNDTLWDFDGMSVEITEDQAKVLKSSKYYSQPKEHSRSSPGGDYSVVINRTTSEVINPDGSKTITTSVTTANISPDGGFFW